MTWGFVAIGGATLGAALISNDASSSAAKGQQQATQSGINEQARQFNLTQSQTGPYRDAGTSAISFLRSQMGIGPGTAASMGGQDWKSALKQAYQDSFPGGGNPNVLTALYGVIDKASSPSDDSGGESPLQFARRTGIPTPSNLGSIITASQQPAASAAPGAAPGAAAPGATGPVPTPGPGTAAPGGAAPGDGASSPLLRNFSISDFWNDPVVQASYQSGLDLGTKALKNAAPLTTGLDSGAAMKELTKFGTDYTGNMAAGSQQRFIGDQSNQFNRLAAMAGIGQTGIAQTSGVGVNTANNTSNLLTSNANAQGAAKIAGANTFGTGVNSVANYWNQQQMLSNMKGNNTGGTTGYSPAQSTDWYAG